jgi:hypothetical protein
MMNQFSRRGKSQETIGKPLLVTTVTNKIDADTAKCEIILLATMTLSGATTMQLPCVAADAGQWWWIDTSNITYGGQTLTISGTATDGTATTGISSTAQKKFAFYWSGTDIVAMTAVL